MPAESAATRVRTSGQTRAKDGRKGKGEGRPEGECLAPSNADQGPNPSGTPPDQGNRRAHGRP
eukprot:2286939-Alexandrium_andersonii.AAC.1